MTKTVLEVLEGALEILRDPKRWTKREYSRDINDRDCSPHSSRAKCFCAIGAIMRVSGSRPELSTLWALHIEATNVLRRVTRQYDIGVWNDAPERTHAEIIQGFEKAIAVEKSK
jgi:hypothetical protein